MLDPLWSEPEASGVHFSLSDSISFLFLFILCLLEFSSPVLPLKSQRLSQEDPVQTTSVYFWTLSADSEVSEFPWELVRIHIPPMMPSGEIGEGLSSWLGSHVARDDGALAREEDGLLGHLTPAFS